MRMCLPNRNQPTPSPRAACRIVAVAACFLSIAVPSVFAATFTVSKLNDENDGGANGFSLREAIINANVTMGADEIDFSVTGTITLESALPAIDDDLEINGPGATLLTISGDNAHRPFFVDSGTTVIRDVTIANGRAKGGSGAPSGNSGGAGGGAGMGGAIFIDFGATARCEDVIFSANTALGGSGGSSAVTGETAAGGGGGFGGDGVQGTPGSANWPGGMGGSGGLLGGAGGAGSPNFTTAGATGNAEGGGGGGGGVWNNSSSSGTAGGNGGFGGGGGGGGVGAPNGGAGGGGGFGGGAGGGGQTISSAMGASGGAAGTAGTHGGTAGAGGPSSSSGSGGGGGGGGLGGAIYVRASGTVLLSRCTFNTNAATGGSGGSGFPAGGSGEGKGGAIYVQSTAIAGGAVVTYGSAANANSATSHTGGAFDNQNNFNEVAVFPAVQSITRVAASPTNASSVQFAVVFSQPVTGVGSGDFVLTTTGVSGASVGAVTGSGTSYNVTVNAGTGSGTIRLDLLDDDSIQWGGLPIGTNGVGNGDYDNGETYTIDNTAPTLSSVSTTPTIGAATNATSIQIDITMSESVTGFADGDVTFTTGGTAAVGSVMLTTVSATVLRATLSGITGNGTLQVALENAAVSDIAGNPSAAATLLTTSVDAVAPAVLSITPVTSTPTNADSVAFTVVFNDTVVGFDSAADVTVNAVGATVGAAAIAAVSGTTYTVTVSNVAADGTVSLSVNAGAAADAAGNGSSPFGPSADVLIDNTPPTLTIFSSIFTDIGDATSTFFSASLNEVVTGFAGDDVTVNHTGTSSTGLTFTAVASVTYSIEVTGLSGSGSLNVSVPAGAFTDLAGNVSVAGATSPTQTRTPTTNNNSNAGSNNANANSGGGSDNANTGGGVANANAGGEPANSNSTGGTQTNANTGAGPAVDNANSSVPVDAADAGDDAAPTGPCGIGACGVAGFAPFGLMLCMLSLRVRTLRRALLLDVR